MSGTQALLAILLPFLLAGCWLFSPLRCTAGRLAPLSPLPALMLALFGPEWQVDLPWMLLGTQLGLDATGRVFLALTAVLWLAAGLFGKHHFACDAPRPGFQLAWLLTLAGNLGLTVAQDMLSFLLCFTVMSVAAYPLIIHDRTPQSLYAGRIYLLLVVLGELLLFWAAVIAAGQTGAMTFSDMAPALAASPRRGLVTGLLLAGFGIKVGIMPLHGWLPLAHPAAPVAASAVLSGAMIKAGLLGWLRFLPLGSVQLSPWGEALITLGLLSALLAALLGMAQRKPKTVLAYSSVSQMGLASVTVGAGLLAPAAWPALRGALLLFIVSHGMAKAALFLGVGVAQARRETALQRAAAAAGLLLAAASIAGLPLTLGYIAKKSQATITGWLPGFWSGATAWLLPVTAVTTGLLLFRFLVLAWPRQAEREGSREPSVGITAWAGLLLGILVLSVFPTAITPVEPGWHSLAPGKLWSATAPVLAAALIGLLARRTRVRRTAPMVPPGDLLPVLERGLRSASAQACRRAAALGVSRRSLSGGRLRRPKAPAGPLRAAERRLATGHAAGVVIAALILLMFALTLAA